MPLLIARGGKLLCVKVTSSIFFGAVCIAPYDLL